MSAPSVRWRALRVEFPRAARRVSLDLPPGPPLSRRAIEEGQRYFSDRLAGDGTRARGGDAGITRVRTQVAALLGVAPDHLRALDHAAQGLERVAQAFAAPAHVVAMADDTPEVRRPFERMGHPLTLVPSCPDGSVATADVAGALRPDTRLVLTSTILAESGFLPDITAIGRVCRARGVSLVVDASPALGARPIDVAACDPDVLVCGLDAGGAMVYAHPRVLDHAPRLVPPADAAHPAGIMALGGALDLLLEAGMASATDRLHALTAHLHRRLDEHGFEVRSPRARDMRAHLTIVGSRDPVEEAARLAEGGIDVAAGARGLRVSLHVCTLEEDLDRFVTALARLRRGETLAVAAAPHGPLVCIDLNGVLDAYGGWRGPEHWDPPRPGARDFLQRLRAAGCRIVVFTTRHYRGAGEWLARHDMDGFVDDVTDRKPAADVFVDDRAVCFQGDFDATLREVMAFAPHWRTRTSA